MTAGITAYRSRHLAAADREERRYGGNSAMSGGRLWVPNNHLMDRVGIKDTPEEAWTYIKGTVATS